MENEKPLNKKKKLHLKKVKEENKRQFNPVFLESIKDYME